MPVSRSLPWAMRLRGSGRRRADAGAVHTACMESAPFYVAAPRLAYSGHGNRNPLNNIRITHSRGKRLACAHPSDWVITTFHYMCTLHCTC